MARRTNTKKKQPRQQDQQLEVVRSVRMSAELAELVDVVCRARDIPFSDYTRELLHRSVTDAEDQAIEDCMEYLRRRGVTPDMLAAKK